MDLYDYYTDSEKNRNIEGEDFIKVVDDYHEWLNEPENAKAKVSLKDLADRLDAFMIASDKYDTQELESRLIETGKYTREEIDNIKKEKG